MRHMLRISVVAALAVSVITPPASGVTIRQDVVSVRSSTCFGRTPTLVGTDGDDVLNGGSASDVIDGRGGDDIINGNGGKDYLCGGSGDDTISGGRGRDRLKGGSGDDTLVGDAGNDSLNGGGGVDTLTGGRGTDTCRGEVTTSCELPVDEVTGDYTYYTMEGPNGFREVSVSAQGTNPVEGVWSWDMPLGSFDGPVTCLRVNGADAWLAGESSDGTVAVFLFVHDGGASGGAGDTAFTWGADPGQTLEDMEALCESMTPPPFFGSAPFPVATGNVRVVDTP